MNKVEAERVLRGIYEARVAGDADAVSGLFTEDAVFMLTGSDAASPLPMTCAGREALRETMAGLIAAFPFSGFEILSVVADGSDMAARMRLHVRSAKTGAEATTETADFITLRDGKVASFTQFCDTALVTKLAGA